MKPYYQCDKCGFIFGSLSEVTFAQREENTLRMDDKGFYQDCEVMGCEGKLREHKSIEKR